VGFEFLNVSSTGAMLVAVVKSTLPPSATPCSIPITIGSTTVGTFLLTVPLTAQTISFGAIPAQTAGSTLTLAATASSGLAGGTCTITASQAGNATYAAAKPVAEFCGGAESPVHQFRRHPCPGWACGPRATMKARRFRVLCFQ